MKKVKAYKVFNPDWTCRGYDFKTNNGSAIDSVHEIDGEPKLCSHGFHACVNVAKCFDYYEFNPKNKVAEVTLSGVVIGNENDKICASKITIIREISWEELLQLVNSGIGNSGDWNSGNWNSGDGNSGYFNTNKPNVRIFGKETHIKNIVFPNYFFFDFAKWVYWDYMTDKEKEENKNAYITGGYLQIFEYKEAWKK